MLKGTQKVLNDTKKCALICKDKRTRPTQPLYLRNTRAANYYLPTFGYYFLGTSQVFMPIKAYRGQKLINAVAIGIIANKPHHAW